MKRALGNLGLVILSLVFVFVIGEVVCRFTTKPPMQVLVKSESSNPGQARQDISIKESHDQLYQYTLSGGVRLTPNANILVKNHYLSHQDVDIQTNSLGFRAPEPAAEKGGERRILVLGDSITLGDYVQAPDTYPQRLETYLQKQDANIRVFNAGIGSADIHNETQILKESGLKLQPDVVLVGLYLNDGELSANLVLPPLPGLLRKSYFANFLNRRIRLLVYRWQHRAELAGEGKQWLEKFAGGRELKEKDWKQDKAGLDFLIVKNARDWGAAWDPMTWQVVEKYLGEIKAEAARSGFKVYVALFPVRYQVEAEYLDDQPQQYFKALMQRMGVPALDLLPVLRDAYRENSNTVYYYDKCHLTPIGNDVVAKSLAAFLQVPNP